MPVSYVKTQQIIRELWQRIQPKFAVHLGIARGSRVFLLEQTGRNRGYKDRDVCGFCPQSCVERGPEKLHSVINMRDVSQHFKDTGIDVLPSADAGRFLCDFAYYCSLYHGHQRAAFIHMPSSGMPVPLLQALILTMLHQLEDPGQPASSSVSGGLFSSLKKKLTSLKEGSSSSLMVLMISRKVGRILGLYCQHILISSNLG
ncbi:Pyroglutamyl-peptidase 1 [Oryzias melastigma]|uniref:Pyroglutamyl-peptidase 1 n=1 Tax=Oryzias melastigma TaxID=30732 RepID=A0A834FPW6_ORYME|nr:Pyroglutamyl-peptidase 1 [Oryzias melastigma]